MEKKSAVKLVIGILVTVILLLGGTYAAWNFLTEKTDIVMTVGGDQISFNAGTDITVDGLLPVYSMYSETKGNVYGVYDMSGGANEYVMAMMIKEDDTLFYQDSGFNNTNIATYVIIIDGIYYSKYFDIYEYGNSTSDYSRSKLGDATGETNGWYGDYKQFISSFGWFSRGGGYGHTSSAGLSASSMTLATPSVPTVLELF